MPSTQAPSRAAHDTVGAVRRFYRSVGVAPREGGWAVLLDGRAPKTPAGAPLVLPAEALARQLAAEWEAQVEFIRFPAMPATRLAFTAIDQLPGSHAEVAAEVARYAGSDLLCYFAESPTRLVERQAREWSPVLDWAERELDLRLERTAGVVHCPQPAATLARAETLAGALDVFALAALAHATALFGSALLAFALARGRLSGPEAFALSRLDEAHQEEQWGVDAEAAERTERLRGEAAMLDAWFAALR